MTNHIEVLSAEIKARALNASNLPRDPGPRAVQLRVHDIKVDELVSMVTAEQKPIACAAVHAAIAPTPASVVESERSSRWDVLITSYDGSGNVWTRSEVIELAERLEASASSAVLAGELLTKKRAVEDRAWCRNQVTLAALALRTLATQNQAVRTPGPGDPDDDSPLTVADLALEECLQLGYTIHDEALIPPDSPEWQALAASRLQKNGAVK